MRSTAAIALIFLASSAPVLARENCGDLTNQTDMNICAGKAYQTSDAELNRLYKRIEQRLKGDADTTRLLVSAQKAWIAFRDAECEFSSSAVAGGSAQPFIRSSCLDGMTQTRIDNLKTYLNCQGGDMSCPVPAGN
ncbi:lysozyme inhibitor LprI family protein [Phyllobacterium sp. 21LDTY02-6]|uniref:lysozyme inhibitor LprI family protein n=1 Tax=Phyllobacterium sp. 21LDTY02-6 TaxID=2944903 RepID=UPI002020442A|nr:lysozyme inhibitor LprI family protein [Phyllobacterium sp. 21LDTY02-6]MCO4316826.1 lysozyme inhibitor LprI family protein [Phyllobacterium sp. 21LDTY02-6]